MTKALPDLPLYQKPEEVPLWIIILAVCGGLLLLILLIFCLWKVTLPFYDLNCVYNVSSLDLSVVNYCFEVDLIFLNYYFSNQVALKIYYMSVSQEVMKISQVQIREMPSHFFAALSRTTVFKLWSVNPKISPVCLQVFIVQFFIYLRCKRNLLNK